MMHSVQLTESQPSTLALTNTDAQLLRRLGKQMASNTTWWGADSSETEAGDDAGRSVIRVELIGEGHYRVTVMNMVGVVRLSQVQLEVVPKIPLHHFMYLVERSTLAPRSATSTVSVAPAQMLLEMLAQWCLEATETLLRQGLRSDYKEFADEQPALRGQLLAGETALEMLRGRPVVHCVFEELSEDAPLNRVVRAACQRLARLDLLTDSTRARARKVVYRMDGVGALQPSDLKVGVDHVSRAYMRVVPLAHLILRSAGLSFQLGPHTGAAFLFRTPELIEEGLRAVVAEALPGVAVTKRRLLLGETKLSMNPDLVFDDSQAVGDIKYRFLSADWDRGDLYQSVTFATAFRTSQSLVVGFARESISRLPPAVQIGDVFTHAVVWHALQNCTATESAEGMKNSLSGWWLKTQDAIRASIFSIVVD